MQTIGSDGKLKLLNLEVKPDSSGRNRREVILNDFLEAINQDRLRSKMKKLPYLAIKRKFPGEISDDDLHWFFKKCEEYAKGGKGRTFSKCFFGALKVKK